MLTKSQILDAIKKSLVSYNSLVTSQITEKINAHNTAATATAQGHMTPGMVTKLNGIADGAEVNQNAIDKKRVEELEAYNRKLFNDYVLSKDEPKQNDTENDENQLDNIINKMKENYNK